MIGSPSVTSHGCDRRHQLNFSTTPVKVNAHHPYGLLGICRVVGAKNLVSTFLKSLEKP